MNSCQVSGRTKARLYSRFITAAGTTTMILGLGGCSYSPSINVMGSYFPAWILCCVAAIGLTALAHALFARWKLFDELWPLPILYPCLICFVSCALWLTFFR